MPATTRRLIPTIALLLVAALLPSAASADCNSAAADCDWTGSDSYPPIPMEVKQFTALVDLRQDNEGLSEDLYTRIVTGLGFELPAEPVVALWSVEVDIPNRQLDVVPFFPTSVRWMEGAISLRVRNGDEEGWSHISMPTNSDFAYDLGREAGMPKYMGDMSITETDDGWSTTTSIGELEASHYEFTPADVEVGADSLLRSWAMHDDPYLHANPVFEGPSRTRVKYTALPLAPADWLLFGMLSSEASVAPVTGIPEPTSGTMSYRIDPDLDGIHALSAATTNSTSMRELFGEGESLADLIEPEGTVTGEFLESIHHLLIQTSSID